MARDGVSDKTVSVDLTPFECRALRMAAIFGTPTPTPPEVESAVAKLREAEDA